MQNAVKFRYPSDGIMIRSKLLYKLWDHLTSHILRHSVKWNMDLVSSNSILLGVLKCRPVHSRCNFNSLRRREVSVSKDHLRQLLGTASLCY